MAPRLIVCTLYGPVLWTFCLVAFGGVTSYSRAGVSVSLFPQSGVALDTVPKFRPDACLALDPLHVYLAVRHDTRGVLFESAVN